MEALLLIQSSINLLFEKYDKENKLGEDGLSKKDEVIILTKTDVTNSELVAKKIKEFVLSNYLHKIEKLV